MNNSVMEKDIPSVSKSPRKEDLLPPHRKPQGIFAGRGLMKRSLVLMVLLSLFLLAGCGSSNPASTTTSLPQSASGATSGTVNGYLANQDTQILYVQWTESNGQFTGSWNSAILLNGSIAYSNFPMTGTHDSSSGSVNMIVDFNGKQVPISGTAQGSTLALQMQQNGQNTNWTLHAASNLDYQSTLTSFQQKYQSS